MKNPKNEMQTFSFSKTDKRNEMQKDEFYDFCVTNLDTGEKFWTDDIFEAHEAAESVGLSQVWDTNENQDVCK
tara:strand:+ start:12146 stop:12364 length:219 start_codon:yes stop_codon:yes gene_type:complete